MNCCSVSGKNCNCPAGYGTPNGDFYENKYSEKSGAKFICFRCGEKVCGNCSEIIEYLNYGEQRICENCIEEIEHE